MNQMNNQGISVRLLTHYQRQQSSQQVGSWQHTLPVTERVGRATEL